MHFSLRNAAQAAVITRPSSHLRLLGERAGIFAVAIAVLIMLTQPLFAHDGAHDIKVGDLVISQPWTRATPTGAKVAGGFFTITNTGAQADRLVAATGEIAGKTEIHEMSVNSDGVMTMRPLGDGLEIPAGGVVELKPGGFHIMFMELTEGASEGEMIKGTLTFENAGTVDVMYSVESMGGSMKMDHKGHGN